MRIFGPVFSYYGNEVNHHHSCNDNLIFRYSIKNDLDRQPELRTLNQRNDQLFHCVFLFSISFFASYANILYTQVHEKTHTLMKMMQKLGIEAVLTVFTECDSDLQLILITYSLLLHKPDFQSNEPCEFI